GSSGYSGWAVRYFGVWYRRYCRFFHYATTRRDGGRRTGIGQLQYLCKHLLGSFCRVSVRLELLDSIHIGQYGGSDSDSTVSTALVTLSSIIAVVPLLFHVYKPHHLCRCTSVRSARTLLFNT